MENIADRIKLKRKELGISQVTLAKQCGAHAITVARWETGAMKPSAKHIEKLADTLGVPLGWLLSGGPVESVPVHRFNELASPGLKARMRQFLDESKRKQIEMEREFEALQREEVTPSPAEEIIRSIVSRMPRCKIDAIPHFGIAAADEQDGRHWDGDVEPGEMSVADAMEPRVVTVRGASAEEFARDGQQCVIDIAHTNVAAGDLCVVLTQDKCLRLKRKSKDRGRMRVYTSINRDYPAFEVAARDVIAEFPVVTVLVKTQKISPVETVAEPFPV